MQRDSAVFLDDIVEACRWIAEYTDGLTADDFAGDRKTLDAVIRNLEIIGEAVKKIPPAVRSDMPDIEWQRIAGLRDILAHAYFAVDTNIVWDVARNKVPLLQQRVEEFLSRQ